MRERFIKDGIFVRDLDGEFVSLMFSNSEQQDMCVEWLNNIWLELVRLREENIRKDELLAEYETRV